MSNINNVLHSNVKFSGPLHKLTQSASTYINIVMWWVYILNNKTVLTVLSFPPILIQINCYIDNHNSLLLLYVFIKNNKQYNNYKKQIKQTVLCFTLHIKIEAFK